MKTPMIGIDLGTTNSLVAVFEDSGPRLIKNAIGQVLTPSAVSVLDDGTIITGQAAKDRLVTHSDLSVASFKRFMGTKRAISVGKRVFSPVELSALILKSLKQDAEADLGTQCDRAVISVPAYFHQLQRKATMEAAKLAGLQVERLINEPTAAALAYGLASKDEGNFLIFDLGGGTFDVSILQKYEGVMEVKATTGDTRLGGDDFSNALIDAIVSRNKLDRDTLSVLELGKVSGEADRLKVALTTKHDADYDFMLGNKKISGAFMRSDFERLVAPLVNRLRTPTERAVRDSGLDVEEFAAVVLVGGATRMPMVRSLVAKMFGRLPLINIDPDTTVALGAATQAGLAGQNAALQDIVMTDVCPHSLGVRLQGENDTRAHVSTIIERNAMIPISRSTELVTRQDFQASVCIGVYQGENLRPENNTLLGELNIPLPKAKAGQEPFTVRYTFDMNGVLQVEVEVLSNGYKATHFYNAADGVSRESLEESFRKLDALKLHPRDQAENQALLSRAERLYEEMMGTARTQLGQKIRTFEHELENQQLKNADRLRQDFETLLSEVEAELGYLD